MLGHFSRGGTRPVLDDSGYSVQSELWAGRREAGGQLGGLGNVPVRRGDLSRRKGSEPTRNIQ